MTIIVDAFGGDNAPLEIIKGCAEAVEAYGVNILLTGREDIIRKVAEENDISLKNIEIEDCPEVITMEDEANSVRKTKKDSSMAVGFRLLNEGRGDAFISAGNSGALCVGATVLVKRIKGIKRPAFAPVLPAENGFFMLLDGGANVECRPEMLYQFAVMGSIYMEEVMKVKASKLNFIGNVEGRDLSKGVCDVVVCDGFSGNLVLKTYEGVALTLLRMMKHMFTDSVKGKMAAALVMKDLKGLKEKFNYNAYGAAPILGASKPVFKAHGDSKAVTIRSGIKLVMEFVEGKAIDEISSSL